MCTFCENHEETLSHLVGNCKKVRSFWNIIFAWLKEKNIRNVLFTDEEYFVGTLIINNFYFVNTVIIFANYFIFTCKMQKRYSTISFFSTSSQTFRKYGTYNCIKKNVSIFVIINGRYFVNFFVIADELTITLYFLLYIFYVYTNMLYYYYYYHVLLLL